MSERGFYAVIEGSDGTGKSTQASALVERAKSELDQEVVFVREPGFTSLGNHLRAYLLDPENDGIPPLAELCLFTAGRVDLWDSTIQPALNEDKVVISDRNWYSTLAYQGAGSDISVDTITNMTKLTMPERYITPDLTIVYDVSEEARRERIGGRAEAATSFEGRGDPYFERVQKGYQHIVRNMGAVGIDASGKRDDVAEMTWRIFSEHFQEFRKAR